MREQGLITVEQEAGGRRERAAHSALPIAARCAAGWAKEYLRQQFRNEFGGDHPPDWRVQPPSSPMQDAAERAVDNGLARLNRKGLQAALVAMDPRPATPCHGWRSATIQAAPSTARRAASVSPARPLSRSCTRRRFQAAFSPVSMLTELDRMVTPHDPEWRPRPVRTAETADGDAA